MTSTTHIRPSLRVATLALAAGLGLAACGSSSSNGTVPSSKTTTAGASTQVLPVTTNPIKNTSTVKALEITSVLVEDNVDPDTGKAADDHLEVALKNTGSARLTNVEVFYTFTDTETSVAESYYMKLPASFSVPANGERIAHFDNTGATDHFPVNKYSIYATSKNALDVDVTVSATGAAIATKTAKKDAGGAEVPGE